MSLDLRVHTPTIEDELIEEGFTRGLEWMMVEAAEREGFNETVRAAETAGKIIVVVQRNNLYQVLWTKPKE